MLFGNDYNYRSSSIRSLIHVPVNNRCHLSFQSSLRSLLLFEFVFLPRILTPLALDTSFSAIRFSCS